MPGQPGLSDEAIEHETAVALPERDAMSLVDGAVKLVPISPLVIPNAPHAQAGRSRPAADAIDQGIDEPGAPD
jgi:hypothetical protein